MGWKAWGDKPWACHSQGMGSDLRCVFQVFFFFKLILFLCISLSNFMIIFLFELTAGHNVLRYDELSPT